MSSYLLIESRDPFESHDADELRRLARGLVQAGHKVTLFLVQNAVFAARDNPRAAALAETVRAGVTILADEFSLRERGILKGRLVPAVAPAPLEAVIEHLERGGKTLWH